MILIMEISRNRESTKSRPLIEIGIIPSDTAKTRQITEKEIPIRTQQRKLEIRPDAQYSVGYC